MKKFYFAILFFAGVVLISSAQTNSLMNPVAVKNSPPKAARGPTVIESDGPVVIDMNNHWMTYNDHVRVTDPQMKMTCEWLMANLPAQNGERPTNIVAETNVVINFTDASGQGKRAFGDKAVYFYNVQNGMTNETVTLTANPPGKPEIQEGSNTVTADAIVWDRATGKVNFTGNFKVTYWNTNGPAGSNNNNPFFP